MSNVQEVVFLGTVYNGLEMGHTDNISDPNPNCLSGSIPNCQSLLHVVYVVVLLRFAELYHKWRIIICTVFKRRVLIKKS